MCAPLVSPLNVAVVAGEKALNAPLSTLQEKTRLPIAVRLSLALNVNAAVGADVVPLGPLEISQTGGVLSTMTRRVATARFPERSTAVAVSVWAPSPTLVVDHGAVAVTAAAGGGGTEFATSACVSAVNATLEMPLPLSVA
ncbi:MAG: hypothetical protein DMF98_27455 [Acidobacteria bacterium]|nr:MAG: hypothetical protein DMF98_27455 [Acidobacteriota bacterium]